MRNLFWFLFFALQQKSQQEIQLKKFEIDKTISDSISKTIVMLARLKIAFWYSTKDRDLVTDIVKGVNMPFVLNAVEVLDKRRLTMPNEVVVVVGDVDVEKMLNDTLWNGNTHFLAVPDSFGNVQTNLETFWKHKVINIFEYLKEEQDVIVYSFVPYKKENCSSITPEILDKYISNMGNFTNNGDAFKDPIRIKNMNGCPINITVVDVKPNIIFIDECGCNGTKHIQGIEGNLMLEIAKKLNFDATFVIALDGVGWGWIKPSPHGAVGEVYTGRSDFAVGLLAPTLERNEFLDLSLPYNGEECITYGVPTGAGASTPDWITILIFEFNPATWGLIFLSFFIIIMFFEVVNKYLKRRAWLPSKTDVLLFVFSSCLGLPVKVPNYFFLRLSVAFWLIFAFIVTVAYRSSMGSKLTVPKKDPDINTFQELLDSNLEFTGYNNMLRLMQFSEGEDIRKMAERFKVTNYDIDVAVDQIAEERKIAYVRHTTTFLYYSLINPKAKGHIHVIKDCLYMFHPMVVTKKRSPFSNRLNELISRLMESGITKKWRADYIYDVPPPVKPFLPLSNDHMYGVFCILALGHSLGVLVFLLEIIYVRCKIM